MKFVVYEVWTRAKVVEAASEEQALLDNEPSPGAGLNLANWHAVAVPEQPHESSPLRIVTKEGSQG
jgi:hypothetical protein